MRLDMLYRVVEIECTSEVFAEKILFKAFEEKLCWEYVEQALLVRERSCTVGNSLFVLNSAGEYMDPPAEIKMLYINNLEPV